jgi:thiol-disulfide isomerase/thioredoxin
MKFCKRHLFVLFVTLFMTNPSFLSGHGTTPPDLIQEITQVQDLRTILSNNTPTVILGHMNNCPHCKSLLKVFETLPTKYPKVNFFIVNGPALKLHEELGKFAKDTKLPVGPNNQFKIPGYPSIIFVKNNSPKDLQVGGNPKTLEEKIEALLKL